MESPSQYARESLRQTEMKQAAQERCAQLLGRQVAANAMSSGEVSLRTKHTGVAEYQDIAVSTEDITKATESLGIQVGALVTRAESLVVESIEETSEFKHSGDLRGNQAQEFSATKAA